MVVEKVYLTWDDINDLLDIIHKKIGDKIMFVTGIPRGGTILAILYSHRFNVKYVDRVLEYFGDELLILDDIADSGKTLQGWSEEYIKSSFATLHYKTTSSFKPKTFAKEIGGDYGWIVYPWEKQDSKTIQDYLDN